MQNRLLIVDDDEAVRYSLKKILESENYQVQLSANANEAMSALESRQFALALLDLNLPDGSGWDVFDRLTSFDPFTPVIIMTGMPHQFPTALIAGAGALVEKPVEVPRLLRIMEELIAEPKERMLRRLCGYLNDTRHVPPANSWLAGQPSDYAETGGTGTANLAAPGGNLPPNFATVERHQAVTANTGKLLDW